MSLLDTHFYDGKLLERKKEILIEKKSTEDLIHDSKKLTQPQKLETLQLLKEELMKKSTFTAGSRNNFETIIRDCNSSANFDASNGFYAEDLLWIAYKLFESNKSSDILDLLGIQLDEMSGGMCSQGRCTRIAQIVFLF